MTTIHFLNELRDSMVALYLDYELINLFNLKFGHFSWENHLA